MVVGAPPGEVVELRVHGVHGTSPASMLGVEPGEVTQVAGDSLTGLYRTRSGELPFRQLRGRPVSVEAYSWGTLTSGVKGFLGWVQRALWLVLLPFALANLAYWARLRLDGSTSASRWGARATRLGALLLTVFMVLVPALVGIDLVAWQCYRGDSPGCVPLPGLLDPLADLSAGQRLAAGSVLPLVFVALLWFLSRQSMLRYEEVACEPDEVGQGPRVLRHPSMWNGKARTQQLQRVHLTVALAVVVAFSGLHVVRLDDLDEGLLVRVSLSATLVLAAVAACWALTVHPSDVERPGVPSRAARLDRLRSSAAGRFLRERLPGALLLAACGTTALHLLALSLLPRTVRQDEDLIGHNAWFIGVFVALTAVHLLLFTLERMNRLGSLVTVALVVLLALGATLAHVDRLPGPPGTRRLLVIGTVVLYLALAAWQVLGNRSRADKAWRGAGSSVMLAAAGWVALLFTTAAVTATANYLNGGDHGVEDLVSRLAEVEDSIALEAVTPADQGAVLAVTGDVVVRDAVLTLDGQGPVLRSGTVVSERLYDVDEDSVEQLQGVALQKGRTRLQSGYVQLETDSVRVQDSCVRLTDRSPCSPESSRILVGGLLELPAAAGSDAGQPSRLRIESVGKGVELDPTSPPAVPLVVPQVLIWAPLAQTAWLLLSAAWVLLAAGVVHRRATRAAVMRRVVDDRIDPIDRTECCKARLRAVFAHRAERVLDGIGFITSALVIGLIAMSATGEAPWERYEVLRPFATVGMYVALGLGAATVLLLSRYRTSGETRKAVGVLWDLTTFWPRAAHPLAPPCYAERVVPELGRRVRWVLHYPADAVAAGDRSGNLVVLSGHSQGSVIVCAVLSRLADEDLRRARVITYGSQIRALYGRVFPDVFGAAQIGYAGTRGPARLSDAFPDVPADPDVPPAASDVPVRDPVRNSPPNSLAERLTRHGGSWVNLFRRSDPLGYRVFSDADVEPDCYVPEVPDVIIGDAGPQVNTHSGYQHTLAYRWAVAAWTHEPVQRDPAGTTKIPSLPV